MTIRLVDPKIIQSNYAKFGDYNFSILVKDYGTDNFYLFRCIVRDSFLISSGSIANGVEPLSYCISNEYYDNNYQYASILCKVGNSIWIYKTNNYNNYNINWSQCTNCGSILNEFSFITPIKFSYNGKVQIFIVTDFFEETIIAPKMYICNMNLENSDLSNYTTEYINPFRTLEITSEYLEYTNNLKYVCNFVMDKYGYILHLFVCCNGIIYTGKTNTYDQQPTIINYKDLPLYDEIKNVSCDSTCNTIVLTIKDTSNIFLSQDSLINYNKINDYVDCNYLINFKLINEASLAVISYRKDDKNYIEVVYLPKSKYPRTREINSYYLNRFNSLNTDVKPTYQISEYDDYIYIDNYINMSLVINKNILPKLIGKTLTIIKRQSSDDNLEIGMSNYDVANDILFLDSGSYSSTSILVLGNNRTLTKYVTDGNLVFMSQ